MKRILFLLFIGIAAVSCKECPECPDTPPSGGRMGQQGMKNHPTDTIVVNRNDVDLDWALVNSGYICGTDSDNGHIFIGLSKITDDDTNANRAKWLRDNRSKIEYNESSKFILARHRMPRNIQVTNLGTPASITLGEIKKKINLFDAQFPNLFEDDKYHYYVKFSIDGNNVRVDSLANFKHNQTCFSIPFLRSIVKHNPELNDNSEFIFNTGSTTDGDILFFEPYKGSRYMDYSHVPSKNKIVQ